MSEIKIKDFSIFGNHNKGLKKIIIESEKQQTNKTINREVIESNKVALNEKITSNKFTRGVGAPVQNHDQALSAKQPLKLSAIVVSLTRILTEKYMAENTRDEVLRLALNDYIKHNLTKEDKVDLLSDMENELNIFRQKYPTMNKYNAQGELEKSKEELEIETIEYLKNAWSI